jgi:arylformamidase
MPVMHIRCLAVATVLLACSRTLAVDDPAFFDVNVKSGVIYYQGDGFDEKRHSLDLYLPKNHKNYPVVFMVHGGGWSLGDKNQFGLYSRLGRNLARHGIGMVSTNYRLSPAVKHPEHIRDVARAFAWVHKNIGKHGGNNREMFVGGHSAGGHLSALLATDETYLKEQGLSLRDIKGAMPVSGVFTIPSKEGNPVFDKVFDQDAAVRDKASPTKQARAGLPPFLILYASTELPYCDRPYAEGFCKALTDAKNQAVAFEFKPRNHLSIMLNATSETDPVFQSMLSFVTSQVALDRMCGNGCDGVECLQLCLTRYLAPSAK